MDKQALEAWLEPLPGDSCGPDLEYDPGFLELAQAALGKGETQFAPAEPPVWATVQELSGNLLSRTRDLRVALLWGRAVVNLEGLEGLAPALHLLNGLLDRFWDDLHPRLDDGDAFARLGVLHGLDALENLLGDVRQAPLLMDRRLGGLRMRAVEIALDRLPPRADETTTTTGQITGMLGDFPDLSQRLTQAVDESLGSLKSLQSLMNERFGMESAVDLKALRSMLTGIQSLIPTPGGEPSATDTQTPESDSPEPSRRNGGGMHSIESRQDALRAIHMVCAYLERAEPTNPAQMLLRRAERLIDKDFLQLVRDLAPDAVAEVAKILGINTDESNGY